MKINYVIWVTTKGQKLKISGANDNVLHLPIGDLQNNSPEKCWLIRYNLSSQYFRVNAPGQKSRFLLHVHNIVVIVSNFIITYLSIMMSKTYLQNVLTLVLIFAIKPTICNEGPVIGVLTQDIYWSIFTHYKPSNLSTLNSYVAASYVKAIEASGGWVVLVFNNKSIEYYE